eukprot:gnl/TRDRNA2_/TRDRNA2_160465_c0_seq1.p1 gnl/TRDRNA2_/TRDRNA2_160465_c0~~gnl/TRDRNA2_/TRDRNA2_160465_c0_seq1.p1  ORF type:complete len:264 (-),score=31.40 gnl/TRDRNA2_/TRDRNA2_160465_c0_seq1:18-809(-)
MIRACHRALGKLPLAARRSQAWRANSHRVWQAEPSRWPSRSSESWTLGLAAAGAALGTCTTVYCLDSRQISMKDEYGVVTSDGQTEVIEQLALDSGRVMRKVDCRFNTWGKLNEKADNCIVVCHALTGNSDAKAWWGALIGPGKPLDTNKYFIFCANVLGSCYGSTGPQSIDPLTGKRYGMTFPQITVRDMVRMQSQALAQLGVKEVLCAVGGSMGGMQVLEFAAGGGGHVPPVKSFISLSASGRHHAWQIGISECQRQAIYA